MMMKQENIIAIIWKAEIFVLLACQMESLLVHAVYLIFNLGGLTVAYTGLKYTNHLFLTTLINGLMFCTKSCLYLFAGQKETS